MTDTIAYRPLLIQHGIDQFTGAARNWVEFDLPEDSESTEFAITLGDRYVQTYDFELTFDSERNLPLDPPNYFTQSSTSEFFTATLATSLTVAPPLGVTFSYYTTLAAQLWSSDNLPTDATDAQTIEIIPDTSAKWVLNGSTLDLVYGIDFNIQYGSKPTESIQKITKSVFWNGLLKLGWNFGTIDWNLTKPLTNRGFMLGQFVNFHTGWENRPASRGRPVTDMKTGLPAFAEDLVEDGYKPGIWTSSAQWDPIDPRDVRPVEFPDEEGVKTDDVPV